MARVRAADYDDKRVKLLMVAARLFARNGFDRTSMAQLGEAAGVSKALLYHYYENKDALLFDIVERHLCALEAQILAADAPGLAPPERLRALIGAALRAYRDSDALHKVQINELDKLPATHQRAIRKIQRRIVALFAAALAAVNPHLQDKGEAALLKPVTMCLFGAMNWSYLWFRDDGPLSREAYADLVAQLFAAGVGALAD
ncbi:MAG: TetR family transcriptional regulator [Hyphomicrobiales bacterium]|nr:TetR family transcriptional regulator [Hyphomicrobiales bacterium]